MVFRVAANAAPRDAAGGKLFASDRRERLRYSRGRAHGRAPLYFNVWFIIVQQPTLIFLFKSRSRSPNRLSNVHLGQPSDGFTPLQIAASQGHSDAAVLLLDAGARADDRDQHGQTALHFASAGNHPKMLKLLLQA